MTTQPPNLDPQLLNIARYPRTNKYDPAWIVENAVGAHTLWLQEGLCADMDLRPGMRVLDIGCGKAISSIFLAKEYGVQVWATDLWFSATENLQRIVESGVENLVFPIHADARDLPYADGFFDALVSINSLYFYATDDMYLRHHLLRLVKSGGQIGVVLPGFYHEFGENIPEHLRPYWDSCTLYGWHSADWWRWHFEKTGLVEVELADTFPDREGYEIYRRWDQVMRYDVLLTEIDQGQNITFVRLVARRK